jgi:hypothetical protein
MRCDAGTIRAAVLDHLVAVRGPVGVAVGQHPFVSAFFVGSRFVKGVGALRWTYSGGLHR